MNILLIYREERFSPSSVEKDKAILDAVADNLRREGCDVTCIKAGDFDEVTLYGIDAILSMARGEDILEKLEKTGVPVLNSPRGIRMCSRRYDLDILLRKNGMRVPPTEGNEGVWIKRGDASAEIKDDVVLCHTAEEEQNAIENMKKRGIDCWVRQAHMSGDLVKFYGVEGRFFQFSYPTDTGHSKFGLEEANGKASHFAFDETELLNEADRIARLSGVRIYGGDAIVRVDGSFFVIDFNDWPTFSSCRKDASESITELCINLIKD